MKELDNIHCDFSAIDGREKEFNAILTDLYQRGVKLRDHLLKLNEQ